MKHNIFRGDTIDLRSILRARTGSTIFLVANLLVFAILSLIQMRFTVKYCGLIPWSTVALGGLAGGFAQNLIDRGFSISGSAVINESGARNYWSVALLSLRTKSKYVPFVLLGGCSYAYVLPQTERTLFLFTFVSSMCLGFSLDWVFVGLDSPRSIFIVSTVPKFISSFLGIVGIYIFKQIYFVPYSLFFYAVANLALGLLVLKSSREKALYFELNKLDIVKITRSVWSRITADLYWILPGMLVVIFSPTLGLTFLVVDRVVKFFVAPSIGATQALGSYLIINVKSAILRIRISFFFHAITATVISLAGIFAVPFAVTFLSNNTITLSYLEVCFLSLYIFFVVLSRSFTFHYYYLSEMSLVPAVVNILSIIVFSFFISFDLVSTLLGVIALTAFIQFFSFAVYYIIFAAKRSTRESISLFDIANP